MQKSLATELKEQGSENREAVYLTDLSACIPSNALSANAEANRWQVVPYTAEGGLAGKMLAAEALVDAPDVTLPISVKGWYAISFGFWRGIYYDMTFKHRLSSEKIFTRVHAPFNEFVWDRTELLETFPIHADLTGEKGIVFSKPRAFPPRKACIAYVKLTPLCDQEVEQIKKDRQRTDTRRIVATNDCEGTFRIYSTRTREELLEDVEPYRYSDVGKVFWGVNIGDLTYYKSKVGKFYMDGPVYPLEELRFAHENFRALHEKGIEPYQAIMEHVHEMGLEFYTYYRMAMIDHAHPYNIFPAESVFLPANPHCRIVAKDGTPIMKASYAFAETHDFMINLMAEAMRQDIDGVALCFIRGPEYFGYEKPIVDEYIKRHGKDPRQLPDDDANLQALWAEHMTAFMRKVRRAADEHGTRRGRKIKVAAWVDWSYERMARLGYDTRRWIEEKLVDVILGIAPQDMVAAARRAGCEVYAYGSGGYLSIADMKHAYAAGMDGLVYWDLDSMQELPEEWAYLSRLGHRDEVLDAPPTSILSKQDLPKMKRTRLLTLAGRDVHHNDRSIPTGSPAKEMLPWYSGG